MSESLDEFAVTIPVVTQETGNDDVDAVVCSLDVLDDLAVADHVALFEQAHESLRRTLVGAGQDDRN